MADKVFVNAEEEELQKAKFIAKLREELLLNSPLKFNEGTISLMEDNSLTLTQLKYSDMLKLVMNKPVDSTSSHSVVRSQLSTKDQFVAQRARGAYVATVSQPEAAFDLSFAA